MLDKLINWLMHPLSQLLLLTNTLLWLCIVLFFLPKYLELSRWAALTTPATEQSIQQFVTLSTPLALSTVTPTLIPTPTPWPTNTPSATPITVALPVVATQIPPAQPVTLSQADLALPFSAICDTNDTLTDIQQEVLANSMVRKWVIGWVGKIYDVERSGDMFEVQVDMRQSPYLPSPQVYVKNISYDTAATLNIGQVVSFDGVIEKVEMTIFQDLCPVYISNATIYPR